MSYLTVNGERRKMGLNDEAVAGWRGYCFSNAAGSASFLGRREISVGSLASSGRRYFG
jgi:hypothetical protein